MLTTFCKYDHRQLRKHQGSDPDLYGILVRFIIVIRIWKDNSNYFGSGYVTLCGAETLTGFYGC